MRIQLLLVLALFGCGGQSRYYQIDSILYCSASLDGVEYRATLFGSRGSTTDCKRVGPCWGDQKSYEPELLGKPTCSKRVEGDSSFMAIPSLESSCTDDGTLITIDKNARSGTVSHAGSQAPMSCSGRTEFRDEHG